MDPLEQSAALKPDAVILDNPIWNALCTEHESLALGDGLARRYPPEIGPLSGMPNQSLASFDALRGLAGRGGVVVLFCTEPVAPPPGWTLVRDGQLDQMICDTRLSAETPALPADAELRRLASGDVAEMVALAKLTEPGPFRERSIELGTFFGIFHGGRLMAMAGRRVHLPRHVEVSAVCTHPEARGSGYARILISAVADEIRGRGKTPFLHTFADNQSAIRVYKSLGFTLRRSLHLAVLKNEG